MTNRLILRITVLGTLLVGIVVSAHARSDRAVTGPRGVFALSAGTKPLPDSVLTDASVTGVSLRAAWAEIEPREGEFVWVFDREVERAAGVGKKVMLRVTAGSNSPDWVYTAGAEKFEFTEANPFRKQKGEALRTPIPWDPVFLAKWKQFVPRPALAGILLSRTPTPVTPV